MRFSHILYEHFLWSFSLRQALSFFPFGHKHFRGSHLRSRLYPLQSVLHLLLQWLRFLPVFWVRIYSKWWCSCFFLHGVGVFKYVPPCLEDVCSVVSACLVKNEIIALSFLNPLVCVLQDSVHWNLLSTSTWQGEYRNRSSQVWTVCFLLLFLYMTFCCCCWKQKWNILNY